MTPADVPGVLAVQEPGAVRGLAKVFPQDRFPFLVVEQEGALIGFAAVRADELMHFGIALERWGTGAAQAAHDAVLDQMRSTHVTRAWLRVFTGNERGRRFYERLGWARTGERSHSGFPPYAELLQYERELTLHTGG